MAKVGINCGLKIHYGESTQRINQILINQIYGL